METNVLRAEGNHLAEKGKEINERDLLMEKHNEESAEKLYKVYVQGLVTSNNFSRRKINSRLNQVTCLKI